MADITAAITDAVREAVRQELSEERPGGDATGVLREMMEHQPEERINLWKPYKAREVAEILGLSSSRVYEIPEDLLKPTWVGPSKGSKRFMGINLVCYMAGIEPVDIEGMAREVRERFLAKAQSPPNVKALGNERRRVL